MIIRDEAISTWWQTGRPELLNHNGIATSSRTVWCRTPRNDRVFTVGKKLNINLYFMFQLLKKYKYPLLIMLLVIIFFFPFFLQGKLPIPSDDLVGMYHPWRDALSSQYPNGYPFKNPLITDPARQQYPYRFLAIDMLKQGELPKWNPYNFSGTPLLANIQSAVFYPLNILFWIFDFPTAWSILIMLQPLLAGIFMFMYLKFLKLDEKACFLGSISFAFSGFLISWLEWNTLGQVILWLPLILLGIDRWLVSFRWRWLVLLIFAAVCSLFAGHLQTFSYVAGFSSVYFLTRIINSYLKDKKQLLIKFRQLNNREVFYSLIVLTSGIAITAVQILPAIKFISLSSRNFDLPNWQRPDWFIPWQNLLQFLAPDFFGNPATGNYWGVWNYGEFTGYVGLISIIFGVFAMIFRRDKKTLFFGAVLFICLFFGLATFLGKLPYQLSIPFISTMQPSRIICLIDFILAVLTALGFDYLIKLRTVKNSNWLKQIIIVSGIFTGLFVLIWIVVLLPKLLGLNLVAQLNLLISRKNLILPTILMSGFLVYLSGLILLKKEWVNWANWGLLIIIILDLLRFGQKFTPFTNKQLLFPQTKTIEFLQQNLDNFRFMAIDRQIFPPNTSAYYKLQDVSGYDPLYLKNYFNVVSSWTRGKADLTPAAFNRIITPDDFRLFWTDLLGVKYVLSLNEEKDPKLKQVFQEGQTRIYENLLVAPRAFLVEEIQQLPDEQKIAEEIFSNQKKLTAIAYTTGNVFIKPFPKTGDESVKIVHYSENEVQLKVRTGVIRMLVLTDIYYPDWKVFINGKQSTIFPVDLSLRGVVVPEGESDVVFKI